MSNIYIQEPPTSGKVVMKTTAGDIDLELWTKEAPKACRNFIQLCLEGYYDNTIFHRVVKGFIIQGGDPTGTGEGGESIYGEPFKDEFHTRLRFCRRGLLAMANAGKNDNGSQFFFTLAATPELQNKHTIFGKVAGDTIYNILKLEDALVDENDRPVFAQKILKTEVLNNPFDDIVPRTVPKSEVSEENEKKKSKKDKKGVKDFKLLSFGEEAEDDEEETTVITKKFGNKSKSAHDNLSDPKLSSEPVISSEEPPPKKVKDDKDNSSDDDNDSENVEEKYQKEQEKIEMTERVRNKLKSSKKNPVNDESEEEYYVGKDRIDERKRKTEEIKKEIRDLKREMRNDRNKKAEDDKIKEEEQKKKESTSEFVKEFYETQEEYKKETLKVPKKGSSRENFTMQFLSKFKSKMSSVREKCMDDNDNNDSASNIKETIDDDDDLKDDTWMGNRFKCEEKAPVLAKDANTKSDDWFEIYDPRNPLNKRRRGETSDSKRKPQRDRR
ncbi:spliceosome-associated protein CWC27 homolog [Phymastichus coffea]|uniref:spliceosome-associated protein CWC27 homolog n=1 Tax=Phymastichus coffea TaxID=108790 RepID=UPI00273C97A0|nr:spliceosome-associated protein CWC27 homolog [Phymastichus coffea]XP_058789992.1 spliceosome-associated protein CWC27 homolog [Phymastichus coffea]